MLVGFKQADKFFLGISSHIVITPYWCFKICAKLPCVVTISLGVYDRYVQDETILQQTLLGGTAWHCRI